MLRQIRWKPVDITADPSEIRKEFLPDTLLNCYQTITCLVQVWDLSYVQHYSFISGLFNNANGLEW
jgi:hypothetical protein